MHEVKLRYTEELLRQAVRAFVIRTLWRGLGISFFVVEAVLVAMVIWLISQGDRSWLVGLLVATLLFGVVFFVTLYVGHYRNTIRKFRQMKVPEATIFCEEDSFTLTSEFGTATLPWSAITEVWRFPRFWLILFGRAQFSTLPLDCLEPEVQAFITRKTQRADAT